jgi:hypothetical protein
MPRSILKKYRKRVPKSRRVTFKDILKTIPNVFTINIRSDEDIVSDIMARMSKEAQISETEKPETDDQKTADALLNLA